MYFQCGSLILLKSVGVRGTPGRSIKSEEAQIIPGEFLDILRLLLVSGHQLQSEKREETKRYSSNSGVFISRDGGASHA